MSTHNIDASEIKLALFRYVMQRDSLQDGQTYNVQLVMNGQILMMGDGPLFTVHASLIPMAKGGES
jgi:hypothetical protein